MGLGWVERECKGEAANTGVREKPTREAKVSLDADLVPHSKGNSTGIPQHGRARVVGMLGEEGCKFSDATRQEPTNQHGKRRRERRTKK